MCTLLVEELEEDLWSEERRRIEAEQDVRRRRAREAGKARWEARKRREALDMERSKEKIRRKFDQLEKRRRIKKDLKRIKMKLKDMERRARNS